MSTRIASVAFLVSEAFRGDSGSEPFILLEAVASQDLWIWHAFFGVAGSNNDVNVLRQSLVLNDLKVGKAPDVPFVANDVTYKWGYYLTDGIYPEWAVLMKSISQPGSNDVKRIRYSNAHDSNRKRCGTSVWRAKEKMGYRISAAMRGFFLLITTISLASPAMPLISSFPPFMVSGIGGRLVMLVSLGGRLFELMPMGLSRFRYLLAVFALDKLQVKQALNFLSSNTKYLDLSDTMLELQDLSDSFELKAWSFVDVEKQEFLFCFPKQCHSSRNS
ncbi:ALP1-like protein [Tanacetum coccineum]